ncbi:F-box/LRR-repeat protein 20-like [Mytilus californianus]|uniref:F-box/LRR-repeat protein 20-like n=1 Tax=Mytilus californianus TaxID=6549 RepID=UPI0022482181|nr:F-box/LRR-repeat protein 20-like [Mytilus californianus]
MNSKDNMESQSYSIMSLPDEVIVKILSYISQYELIYTIQHINTDMHQLCFAPLLWKSINSIQDLIEEEDDDPNFKTFFRTILPYVEQINIDIDLDSFFSILTTNENMILYNLRKAELHFVINGPEELERTVLHLPDIREIKVIVSTAYTDRLPQCTKVLSSLTKLERLTLVRRGKSLFYHKPYKEDRTRELNNLISNHPGLKMFSIERQRFHRSTFELLLSTCKDLECIKLNKCIEIRADGIDMPLQTSLTSFISKDCKIDDHFVEVLTESCPNLKKISFDQCQTINDKCLQHIRDNCPLLEDLILNQQKPEKNITLPPQTSISDDGLEKIARGCPILKRLLVNYCNNVSDAGIKNIAEYCPMLLVLETEGCSQVTEDSVRCIASKCKWLHKANFSHCKNITFQSINYLVRKCNYLEKLDLTLCGDNQFEQTESVYENQIIPNQVQALKENITSSTQNKQKDGSKIRTVMPSIENVNVRRSHPLSELYLNSANIDDETVFFTANICADLRTLNLNDNPQVTDMAITRLMQNCKFLQVLHLSGSIKQTCNLTNDSLSSIAKYGENLKALTITGNKQINIDGIKEVICSCDSLTQFDFTVGSIFKVLETQVTNFIDKYDQKRIFMRSGRGMGLDCQAYNMNPNYYNVQLYISRLHSRFTI